MCDAELTDLKIGIDKCLMWIKNARNKHQVSKDVEKIKGEDQK